MSCLVVLGLLLSCFVLSYSCLFSLSLPFIFVFCLGLLSLSFVFYLCLFSLSLSFIFVFYLCLSLCLLSFVFYLCLCLCLCLLFLFFIFYLCLVSSRRVASLLSSPLSSPLIFVPCLAKEEWSLLSPQEGAASWQQQVWAW